VPNFETSRLICRPLTLGDYELFEKEIEPNWIGFSNPYRHLIEGPSPLRFRIPRVKQNPEFVDISIVLAIEKVSNEIVGSAGFHDFPNEKGMIEIGFGIVAQKQNQGFGTELLIGMWKMICARPDVKILRYTVAPDNAPSMKIINKLGFEKVGEQMDPEDGLELIYEMPKNQFLNLNY
jgi:RimJ/RimL family protein N-acetyltransferase